jgi:hypothetical protein
MSGGDVKVVVTVAQPGLEYVEPGVTDAERHSQADDLAGTQATVLALDVAAVEELQRIRAAGAAIHLQPAGKAVQAGVVGIDRAIRLAHIAGGRADAHHVVAATGRESEVTHQRLDVEDIGTDAAGDGRGRSVAVGAFHGKYVAVGRVAQVDAQRLQRTVGDAATGAHQPQPARTADHAVGDPRTGQRAMVGQRVAGVVEHQQVAVARALPVHRQQRIDRVEVAIGVGVALAEAAEQGVAADVDCIVAGSGVNRCPIVDRIHRKAVVAAAAVDIDVLDALVVHHHGVKQGGLAGRDFTRKDVVEGAGIGGHRLQRRVVAAGRHGGSPQHEAVCSVAAGHHQPVAAVGPGGALMSTTAVLLGRHRDKVVLGVGAVIGGIVENRAATPVDDGKRGTATRMLRSRSLTTIVLLPGAAGDLDRDLEQVVEVFERSRPRHSGRRRRSVRWRHSCRLRRVRCRRR